MFKKTVEARGQQRLSGADRKKLRRTALQTWTAASEVDLDGILPPKADVTVTKLANRALVYAVEGGPPLFFDVDGRGNHILPTVYALWKVPSLLPSLELKGGEVSRYVLGGADLMLPGVRIPDEGLPSFKEGDIFSVRVPRNAAPIAVGMTAVSSEQAIKAELRGKVLRVLHFYGDVLWETAEGRYVPNAGFLDGVVMSDPVFINMPGGEAESSDDEGQETDRVVTSDDAWDEDHPSDPSKPQPSSNDLSGRQENSANNGSGPPQNSARQGTQATNHGAAAEAGEERGSGAGIGRGSGRGNGRGNDAGSHVGGGATGAESASAAARGVEDLRLDGGVEGGGGGEGEGGDAAVITEKLTVEEMDALLHSCLLQSLVTSVKDKELPLAGSLLWSNHILPNRPPGTTVDIKKSSYKKLSKWLQSMAATGLVSVKEDKHRKESMLLHVNRRHADFLSFTPFPKQDPVPPQAQQQLLGGDGTPLAGLAVPGLTPPLGGNQGLTPGAAPLDIALDVCEVYKVSHQVAPIFESVESDPSTTIKADSGAVYSAAEAGLVVLEYAKLHRLENPRNRAMVVLDPVLCDALFKGNVKKGTAYPTDVAKKDLGALFVARMQAHHQVTRGAQSVVKKGALQSVQIVTERRAGNKKVTRVTGVEAFLVDPEALAGELQKKFACSTSVSEAAGKKGQQEVLVQGGVIEVLGRHLVESYGIPKRFIEILDKTNKR
eukprot:TRINITY_DN38362_c0_g1_i1.p1 TRINITY_DN38362_c0_g1~~TRINITY_DN38362_c0_g1_i1.p1  ORF type:complete len:719 (+),score=126.68 TRINITY_DN38362_c0_g1_i1:240-2396(+)